MKETFEFLKVKTQVNYVATVKEDGTPSLRPFGDPAEYSHIQELVEYLNELGFRVPILSNTHNYKNTSIEKITPFVTSLEGTFHAPTAEEHNRFNRSLGSYEAMIENLKKYNTIRSSEQSIGAVLNVMNYNYNYLFKIVENVLKQGFL